MKILGTGLNGLVGSRIGELLSPSYEFENISRSTGVDIINAASVLTAMQNSTAEVVLHLAAKANVDGCETDKEKDTEIVGYHDRGKQQEAFLKEQTAWGSNVFGTQNIVTACEQTKKKLIYISTDFVFDGEHPPKDGYTEEDTPHPINWYARTKYEGEEVVKKATIPWMIVRISYPYRAIFPKNDFVRAILQRLQNKERVTMVTDHVMTPTFIDDIAHALDVLITKNSTGIVHVTGSSFVTPYDAALTIAKTFAQDSALIERTTRDVYFRQKAKRPFQMPMKHAKIDSLGIAMKTFEQGLEEVKRQIFQ